MSFGSVIGVLVLVEVVAVFVALRWLLVGVRSAAAGPVPAFQPLTARAPTAQATTVQAPTVQPTTVQAPAVHAARSVPPVSLPVATA